MSAEKMAAAIYESRNGVGATPFRRQREEYRREYIKDAEAVLRLLKLSPSAASALMDGTAVVVPSGRLTDEQVKKLGFTLHDGTNYPPDNAPFARGSHRAVIAALAYRSNGDDH